MLFLPLVIACGCSTSPGTGGGGGADLANAGAGGDLAGLAANADLMSLSPDMTPNNPPNPAGLGPKPVDIGASGDLASAGSYVLLAKTGITNVTGSMISGGNLGVSPATATAITGFGLMADASKQFSNSASVVAPAHVYAANYMTPTPANLTAAVLSMQTAYNDAAGRGPPDHLNMGSGNLSGLTLAPGLYTWGSTVTIPADVTLAGGANDVWILQISKDLDVSTGMHVLLSGGAQAKNIFWQVAGKVTIHANAHFQGVILCKTGITLQTTAVMTGRALAQSLVAIDNDMIMAP